MAFTLLTTTTVFRAEKTVIQSGSTAGFNFQIRNFDFAESEVRQWGWIYHFWDTGDANIGRVILNQYRLNQARHNFATVAVPEGTSGLILYITERAPNDSYAIALYRRL